MAKTLENNRDDIRTSIHGRRIGLTYDDYLAGPKDVRRVVTNATSDTTGTLLEPYGVHTVVTTTDDGWQLTDPPSAGLVVRIATNSTSTGTHAITPVAATITSTNGTAGSSISMQGVGAFLEMTSISTAQWLVTSRGGSTTAGATVVISS